MKIAVTTTAYNNSVDLPIWLKYYGSQFGFENLYVVDHGSTDGSTDNLQGANRVKIPREYFDDTQRARSLNHMQHFLLEYYDWVIHADCDEIIVPDPDLYPNLRTYVENLQTDFVSTMGVDVVHLPKLEPALDITRPIMQQRKYGSFSSLSCKPLISRVPLDWWVGLHFCQHQHNIDPNLYLFHLKLMDRDITLNRHKTWLTEVKWPSHALEGNYSWHVRMGMEEYDKDTFQYYQNILDSTGFVDFDSKPIAQSLNNSQWMRENKYWELPFERHDIHIIPNRFTQVF